MEYKGTYKNKHVIACSEKEYWENLSLNDRFQDDRFFLVDNHKLIHKCQVYGQLNGNGLLTELANKVRYERPLSYYKDLLGKDKLVFEEEKRAETCLTAPKASKKSAEAPAALEESSKAVDEYLASKKSVDFFFEEINKKEAL